MENLHTTINIQKCTRTSNMLLCLLNLALGHFHAYPKYQFLWAYTSHNIWFLVISKFPCRVFKISNLALIPDTDHEPIPTWCRWKLNVCTWISSCGIFFHVIVRVGSDTDEKRGSGFLAWFVSQIFLLLFCLISPRTFYYWQYLSQDGCGPLFDVKTLWKRRVIKTKLLLLRKKTEYKNIKFWQSWTKIPNFVYNFTNWIFLCSGLDASDYNSFFFCNQTPN